MAKSLLSRALDLLSRREYSRRELAGCLRPHAESQAALDEVFQALDAHAWQSDARFAEQFTRRNGSRHGALRLGHALRGKGISAEVIDQALAGRNELEIARQVWQRKFDHLPGSREEQARQMRFLAGRGFRHDIIRKILHPADDDDA